MNSFFCAHRLTWQVVAVVVVAIFKTGKKLFQLTTSEGSVRGHLVSCTLVVCGGGGTSGWAGSREGSNCIFSVDVKVTTLLGKTEQERKRQSVS